MLFFSPSIYRDGHGHTYCIPTADTVHMPERERFESVANVRASVAAYETEIRGERVRAGQQAARDAGKKWGGSQKGARRKVTAEQVKAIIDMKARGEKIARIARTVSLSRLTIYRVLDDCDARTGVQPG